MEKGVDEGPLLVDIKLLLGEGCGCERVLLFPDVGMGREDGSVGMGNRFILFGFEFRIAADCGGTFGGRDIA